MPQEAEVVLELQAEEEEVAEQPRVVEEQRVQTQTPSQHNHMSLRRDSTHMFVS